VQLPYPFNLWSKYTCWTRSYTPHLLLCKYNYSPSLFLLVCGQVVPSFQWTSDISSFLSSRTLWVWIYRYWVLGLCCFWMRPNKFELDYEDLWVVAKETHWFLCWSSNSSWYSNQRIFDRDWSVRLFTLCSFLKYLL
jgi:hypothetical protein